MSHPTDKRIGNHCVVSVSPQGWPYWTTIKDADDGWRMNLRHEEARDLLYAMQRVVAFLDAKQAAEAKRGVEWN